MKISYLLKLVIEKLTSTVRAVATVTIHKQKNNQDS